MSSSHAMEAPVRGSWAYPSVPHMDACNLGAQSPPSPAQVLAEEQAGHVRFLRLDCGPLKQVQ